MKRLFFTAALAVGMCKFDLVMKMLFRLLSFALTFCAAPNLIRARTTNATPVVPAWAQPGSSNHVQVAPPADFHRPSRDFNTPTGLFGGQSDIGELTR